MGLEFNGGTLYMTTFDGDQVEFANNLNGLVEVDTLSADEVPNISYSLTKDFSASFEASIEISAQDLSFLYAPAFKQSEVFDIEHDVSILTQARWHKKKRINKKWLKRYGMKEDTVKISTKARVLSYNTETGECEFETDKLEYVWRPDQLRKNLKIEM